MFLLHTSDRHVTLDTYDNIERCILAARLSRQHNSCHRRRAQGYRIVWISLALRDHMSRCTSPSRPIRTIHHRGLLN